MTVILLAAGVGKRFGRATQRLPKCLIPIGPDKITLLDRYLDSFRKLALKKIVMVVGHEKEKIMKACQSKGKGFRFTFVTNQEYRKGSILSLYLAFSRLRRDDCLVMDADVFFPTSALKRLLDSKHQSSFLIDSENQSTGEEMMIQSKNGRPYSISKTLSPSLRILGESVGFFKISGKDTARLKRILKNSVEKGEIDQEYEASYNVLIKKIKVGFEKMDGLFWTEMDFKKDLEKILKATRNPTKL